jgi:signal transduction histidine kinase
MLFEDLMTPPTQNPVPWSLILAVAQALVLAVVLVGSGVLIRRYRRTLRTAEERILALRQQVAARDTDVRMRDGELRHLVHTQVPTLLRGLWQGSGTDVPAPLHAALHGSAFAIARDAVLQQFREVAAQATERAEDGAKAAVSTVTRSMQGLLNDTTNAIDAMLRRHHDPAVLADANDIDHASSQLVRRAQVMNVLTGSWPGRRRRDSPLLDVVRGGVSKIRDYDRITITGEPAYSVVSGAVEPVVLAVAELLDNAARHSEPGSDVQVWFVQAHNGVSVMIDDSGVGLKPEARESAARLLTGDVQVRLTQMGSRPKFGFPVVGVLARRYGFRVGVDQESIYGGVRAGIFLPSTLLTTVADEEPQTYEPAERPPAVVQPAAEQPAAEQPAVEDRAVGKPARREPAPRQPAPAETAPAETAPEESAPDEPGTRADGLPQRRRRTTPRPAAQERPAPPAPVNTSANVGAFARGLTRHARDRRTSDERTTDS